MNTPPLRKIRDFESVITALGGTGSAARALRRNPPELCQWRARYNKFPAELYPRVQHRLRKRGYVAAMSLFTFEPVA